jgi:hypothetical protein
LAAEQTGQQVAEPTGGPVFWLSVITSFYWIANERD